MADTNHGASETQSRNAAIGSLAIVGFIALLLIGIATAIYAATFLPKVFSQLSTANVYLSSLVQPNGSGGNTLQVVGTSTAPTSIPLTPATSTPATTTASTVTPATHAPVYTPTYTQPTYQVVTVPQNYYGLPDLVTAITSVGYLRNSGDTSSFIADDSIPSGYQGAVRFVIANRGTNVSGPWIFTADLPTGDSSSDYRSAYQRSLNPGDSVVYTLGFDSTYHGTESIRIDADSNDNVNETNEGNNDDSATIRLNGSSYNNGGSYDSNGNYCSYGTYYQSGRYYCESSNGNNSGSYDSNGNYCSYGTYYQNSRYYCETSNNNSNTNYYDSNGNYCTYGTYHQNNRYYCSGPYGNNSGNNGGSYDSNGNYCSDGSYYSNSTGRTYCY